MMSADARYSYDYNERGRDDNGYEEMEAKRDFVKAELSTRGHIERDKTNAPMTKRSALRNRARRFFSWWIEKPEPKIPQGSIKNPDDAIGLQVFKNSKKPFKSKNVYNTVKAITVNPYTKLAAFTFEEDESIVDCYICNIRERKMA